MKRFLRFCVPLGSRGVWQQQQRRAKFTSRVDLHTDWPDYRHHDRQRSIRRHRVCRRRSERKQVRVCGYFRELQYRWMTAVGIYCQCVCQQLHIASQRRHSHFEPDLVIPTCTILCECRGHLVGDDAIPSSSSINGHERSVLSGLHNDSYAEWRERQRNLDCNWGNDENWNRTPCTGSLAVTGTVDLNTITWTGPLVNENCNDAPTNITFGATR